MDEQESLNHPMGGVQTQGDLYCQVPQEDRRVRT